MEQPPTLCSAVVVVGSGDPQRCLRLRSWHWPGPPTGGLTAN